MADQDLKWWLDKENYKENLTPNSTPSWVWDRMFMRIAREIARTLPKCSSQQIASILVKDRNIISMGFNGTPSGSAMCQNKNTVCPRRKLGVPSGKGLELCPVQHSEENTVHQAAKQGVSTRGATIYCYCGVPCQRCAGALINAGISRIVCLENGFTFDDMNEVLFEEAGVIIDKIKPEDVDSDI
jgi:dCMP deaminase